MANVRISSVATPTLVRKFEATFDTYWNNPEFRPYDPERDADILDRALGAQAGSGSSTLVLSGLEVRPRPHQERILEALALLERSRDEISVRIGHMAPGLCGQRSMRRRLDHLPCEDTEQGSGDEFAHFRRASRNAGHQIRSGLLLQSGTATRLDGQSDTITALNGLEPAKDSSSAQRLFIRASKTCSGSSCSCPLMQIADLIPLA